MVHLESDHIVLIFKKVILKLVLDATFYAVRGLFRGIW
jgi:hypothetical protein